MENNLKDLTREELEQKYVTLLSDFTNYKKRTEALKETAKDEGIYEVFSELMPFYNDLLRYRDNYSKEMGYLVSIFKKVLDAYSFVIMDKDFLKDFPTYALEEKVETIQVIPTKNKELDKTLKDVFSVGLYDTYKDKILVYPKVQLYKY